MYVVCITYVPFYVIVLVVQLWNIKINSPKSGKAVFLRVLSRPGFWDRDVRRKTSARSEIEVDPRHIKSFARTARINGDLAPNSI